MRLCHSPALWSLALALGGCGLVNPNIFDTDIHLQRQDYSHDFGPSAGTIPKVPCSMAADPCQAVNQQVQSSGLMAACDTAMMECYAQTTEVLSYPVNLSQDQAFQSGVGQKAVQFVQGIDLGYSMTSTLTFALPKVDLYVGPQGATAPSDANVTLIGSIGPFAAMQSIPDATPRHLNVENGTPAFAQLQGYIKNPSVPFVFIISTTPRVYADGTSPLPGGQLTLHVYPTITVGLPR